MAYRIQIVEDERIIALDLRDSLQQLGYQVVDCSASGEQAIAQARRLQPDLTLMDIQLEGAMSGIDAAMVLREELDIPVVFLSACAEEHTLQHAGRSAPYGYLLKPFALRELNATLRMALSCHAAAQKNQHQYRQLHMALAYANLAVWTWQPQHAELTSLGQLPAVLQQPAANPDDAPLPPLLAGLAAHDKQQLVGQLARHGQALLVCPLPASDGTTDTRWVEVSIHQMHDAGDTAARLLGVIRDVSERVAMETQLRQASAVFHSTAEGIAIVSPARRIQMANPAFLRMTGHTLADVLQQDIDQLLHDRRHPDSFYRELGQQPNGLWNGEVLCRHQNGQLFPAWEHICAVHNEQDQLSHFIVACSDISAIRQVQRELNHMAFHDALTGLGNRHLLQEQLAIELERAQLARLPLGLIFIDLDGFKLVNDSLGHAAGDRLLQIVAARLKDTLRRADIATRFGGDEFFIVCPGSGEEACSRLATRILNALEVPIVLADESVMVSASIGISLFPQHGKTADSLLRAADSAMYEAKSGGKRRHQVFRQSMADKVRKRMRTEQRLRRALQDKAFELHYQPLYSLQNRQLLGFEALLRWQDQGRLVTPDKFIPIAEECGLIHELGEWVLRSACHQARRWQDDYTRPLRVAVNVSARQFAAADFVALVGTILQESGLHPYLLELEVTESTLQVMEDSQRVLAELKALGVSLAIDDFGTGYSSMALLKHLTIDRLKIDRTFIKDTPDTVRDNAICRAIVALAHSLMLGITAEGIENSRQLHFLQAIGCDTGQGYLFARPLNQAAMAGYLAGLQPPGA